MMWNHSGHLEAFFGIPCAGGILHTLNLRLHPHEIATIVNHARDRFLIVDDVLLPVLEKFRDSAPFEKVIVVPYGCGSVPEDFLNYEELLAEASEDFNTPFSTRNDGAAMCYTSGPRAIRRRHLFAPRAGAALPCRGRRGFFRCQPSRHGPARGSYVSRQRLGFALHLRYDRGAIDLARTQCGR
jgi:hypothetical protein